MSLNWKLPWWGHHPYNLIFFLLGSVLLHGVAFLGMETYSRWSPNPAQSDSDSAIPVEYIEVPAQVALVPPSAAERRASTNTVAGGAARPELPVAAGAGGATVPIPSSQSTTQSSSSPAQPKQPDQPARQPQSSPLVNLQMPTGNLNLSPSPIPEASQSQRQQASSPRTVRSTQKNTGGPAPKTRPAKRPNANRPVPNSQQSPSVDARQDVLLSGYLNMLRREVDQQWLAKEPDATYRVMVAFSVSREGEVTALRILRSSGSSLRDQAALKAVQQAAPFAPLPARYRPSRVDVEFGFNNKVNRKSEPKR